jgi:hypothetical protein
MTMNALRNAECFANEHGIEIPVSVGADAEKVSQIGSEAFAASCLNGDEGPGYEDAIREYADMLVGAADADEARAAAVDDAETFGREVAS